MSYDRHFVLNEIYVCSTNSKKTVGETLGVTVTLFHSSTD